MELKDWILSNIERFGYVSIREGFSSIVRIHNEASYDHAIIKGQERLLYSCRFFQSADKDRYYVLWDRGDGYIIRVKWEEHQHDPVLLAKVKYVEDFLAVSVFGNETWKSNLKLIIPNAVDPCQSCPCYNDKLATGWCRNKKEVVEIWS